MLACGHCKPNALKSRTQRSQVQEIIRPAVSNLSAKDWIRKKKFFNVFFIWSRDELLTEIHLNERGEFLNECGDFLKGESGVRGVLVAVVMSSCVKPSQTIDKRERRRNESYHMITHRHEKVKPQASTSFHFDLHGTTSLEHSPTPDDESQIMRPQFRV